MTTIARRVRTVLIRLAARIARAFRGTGRALRSAIAAGPRPIGARRPETHVGATETFGVELRALRNVDVSPELVSDIETELRWGVMWYEFERTMQAEIDRIFAPYLAVPDCSNFDELRERVGLPEPASS